MFKQMQLDLGPYHLHALKEASDISIVVYRDKDIVGKAQLTTDNIDVSCVTSMFIDDNDISYKFNDKYTLGDMFVKFLIKFPTIARKPEFRFFLDVPENLNLSLQKYHFNRGEGSKVETEILIRKTATLPNHCCPKHVTFRESISACELPKLLSFLPKNAYWQAHLTMERLNLLIANSRCFVAWSMTGELVGFARVVTNNTSFASLWDVVVAENYRNQGIGTWLMTMIFSDKVLSRIQHWLLYTDTAKKLYEKFGFIAEDEMPDRTLVHKLCLQESHPGYMVELIKVVADGLPIHLDEAQSVQFLFGEAGKRAKLPTFWRTISKLEERIDVTAGSNNLLVTNGVSENQVNSLTFM